jgi:viroplasmin and RNaseH domain-containing protein
MAGKFYAVKAGRKTGIFNSWEECKRQVDGYPSASYKSFKTAAEAAAYIGLVPNQTAIANANNSPADFVTDNTAIAYVDGSYNISTCEYGYGVVFFYNGEEIHLKKGFPKDELAAMRNVAGEIKGSEAAISYALSHNISSIKIYHDYEGISKWCTGEWKANKEGTIAYRDFYNNAKKQLKIEFVKVKGHSGDTYNDIADRLAKEAAHVI